VSEIKVGDRVRLLKNRGAYDPIRIGSEGTVMDDIDADGDYDVLWDEREAGEYTRYAHFSTIELVKESHVDRFKPGDRVRVTTDKFDLHSGPKRGDILTVKEPYLNRAGEVLAGPNPDDKHGNYFLDGEIELVEVDLAKDAAPRSYGEVIETALNRLNAAAEAIAPVGLFPPSKGDADLANGLRVLVGGLLTRPRGEKALRALVGE